MSNVNDPMKEDQLSLKQQARKWRGRNMPRGSRTPSRESRQPGPLGRGVSVAGTLHRIALEVARQRTSRGLFVWLRRLER